MGAVLKGYPSGFSGSAIPPQTQPITINTVLTATLARSTLLPHENYTANAEVVTLWGWYNKNHSQVNVFELGEKVIATAKRAFGTDYIIDWFNAQHQNPEFGGLHQQWLDETIRFVVFDEPRRINNITWMTTLKADQVGMGRQTDSALIQHTFKNRYQATQTKYVRCDRTRMSTEQFLRSWLTTPLGVIDLLTSLQVLFGDR